MIELRILLAHQDQATAQRVQDILEPVAGVHFLGHVTSAQSLRERCRELHPDIILIGITLDDMKGEDALRQRAEPCGSVKVIAFADSLEVKTVRAMIRAGASGYILTTDLKDLPHTLWSARNGQAVFSPPILRLLLESS